MRRPLLSLVLAGVLLPASLGGCSYGATTISCPGWVGYSTPREQYDAAGLVVVATAASRDGTTEIFGVDAHSHQVRVSEVLKGEVEGDRVRISSMPDPCRGFAEYPSGDPLEMSTPIIVLASLQDGEWFTLSPDAGTLPVSAEVTEGSAR